MRICFKEGTSFGVDRNSYAACFPRHKRKGLDIYYAGTTTIEFVDEADAIKLAKQILERCGEKL